MAIPIRSTDEINLILNKGNNALASLGLDLVGDMKRGLQLDDTDYRDKVYRLILLRAYLKNIVDVNGDFRAFYPANEKKFNIMLDAIIQLSGAYNGPGIPLIRGKRIPLYFYPSASGNVTQVIVTTLPGIPFSNLDVDSPGEVVDSFSASSANEFVVYNYSVRGSNMGEGNRSGQIIASYRGGAIDWTETKTPDVGGITTPVTFTVAITAGNIELTAVTSTNNWVVKGSRLI